MRQQINFSGLFNSLDETKTPPGRAFSMQNASTDRAILEIGKRYAWIGARPGALDTDICWGAGYGKFSCNSTQALAVTGGIPTSGSATLSWNGHPAAPAAWNITASEMQALLAVISDFEDGEVVCSGGPWPNETIYVTLRGRYAGADQVLFALDSETLNNSATVTISDFVVGGVAEEYLVVVQPGGSGDSILYKVTSADGFQTTLWTSLATNLTSSDWFFKQYSDKIYAANASDGISYKQLGGAWSGPASGGALAPPTVLPGVSQAFTATGTDDLPGSGVDFSAASFASSGFASSPSIAASGTVNIKVTLAATQPSGEVSITATLPVAKDWGHEDYWRISCLIGTVNDVFIDPTTIRMDLINNDGSPVTISPDYYLFPSGSAAGLVFSRYALFERKQRSDRDNSIKIKFTFTMSGANGKIFYITPTMWGTWLNDTQQSIDTSAGPLRKAIQYGYSYFQTSTGLETKISPVGISSVTPASELTGAWGLINASGRTTLLNSDRVYFYRKDRFGQWRRFASTANDAAGGTVQVYDYYMADELDNLPMLGTVTLPGGYLPSNLDCFKGSLCVGSGALLFMSEVNAPLIFMPPPDQFAAQAQFDTTDPDIPRTVYMSAGRSEDILSIVGQDSLYLAGPNESYAMTNGDRPQELSPPRPLPGSRGCLGARAGFPQSGGALIAAKSGLWYYAVSAGFTGVVASGTIIEEEVSKDVRASWQSIFGEGAPDTVVAVFNEETYVFSGAQYLKLTRNKQWEQGTLADGVKAAVPTQANGFVFATTKGELMRFGEETSDAGEAVTWSYVTGKLDGPRSRIEGLEVQYQGSPRVTVEFWDGNVGIDSQVFDLAAGDDTNNYYPLDKPIIGDRYRLTFSGGANDKIELFGIRSADESKGGRGN